MGVGEMLDHSFFYCPHFDVKMLMERLHDPPIVARSSRGGGVRWG